MIIKINETYLIPLLSFNIYELNFIQKFLLFGIVFIMKNMNRIN